MISVFSSGFSEYDLELRSALIRLADDGLTYLAQHYVHEGHAETDFHASFSVAKLIMHGIILLPDLIKQRLEGDTPDVRRISFLFFWCAYADFRAETAQELYVYARLEYPGPCCS